MNDQVAARKPRSNLERTVVWGGILLLLLLVGVQGAARFGYQQSFNRVRRALDDNARSGSDKFLSVDDVSNYVSGLRMRDRRKVGQVTYTWPGLFKTYGFTVSYDLKDEKDRAITGLESIDTPREKPPRRPKLTNAEYYWLVEWFPPARPQDHPFAQEEGRVKIEMPYEGFDPMRYDGSKDGKKDGKLTLDEAPAQMKPYFDKVDANADGFVDQSEVDALTKKHEETQRAKAAAQPTSTPENKPEDQPKADPN